MNSRFLTNYTQTTFLEKIKDNLRHCVAFDFSVSFIKKAGLVLLFKDIEAAVQRGAKGRIITSTYQNFTDIESLRSFDALQNKCSDFECHLDFDSFHDSGYTTLGYHSKGYLFEFKDRKELIVGSSNITRYALLKNIEWDVAVSDVDGTEAFHEAQDEFEDKWANTNKLNREIIERYASKLNFAIERWDMDYDLSTAQIKPNYMQRRALKELNRYRAIGTSRALVVAAAGSGKTYLAAFDALNFGPKRLLYIVHEGTILKKSLETFQEVFGSNATMGIYSGEYKEIDAEFLFSTNVSMAKSLELFAKDEFDYIIIDECHRAAADTYRRIIEYFEPEFLLGLTATPERMDNQDVFELFDKNVPYELRLKDAIKNDLVVPFKYYGIRDTLVDYGLTKSEERKMVAQLATPEHCDFIAKQIEAHRPQGEKLKALAFCRNIQHARMMCENMGEYYRTGFLSGKNNIGERIAAYNDLQDNENGIEILFSVDILNEGVDIPGVNMVLFLRPTESSTIFIQQLGRGLRKFENKSFVTVLDFIGNSYKRSVQIAFALSSLAENFVLEKRLMRSLVKDNFRAVGLDAYGVEINIDDLSKEEIMDSLEKENFNSLGYLKQDYFNFRKYIGAETYPSHMDYLNSDVAPDLLRFMNIKINNRKTVSYYAFLHGIADDEMERVLPTFDNRQVAFIEYLSKMLPLVRKHEYLIISYLLDGEKNIFNIETRLSRDVAEYDRNQLAHALEFMEQEGFVKQNHDELMLNVDVDSSLCEYLDDLISYGLTRYTVDYGDETGFKLWKSYRMDQVQLKLLKNPDYNQLGTYVYGKDVIIFASLKKDLPDEDRLNYEDKYLDTKTFQWECEVDISQKKLTQLMESERAYLFVRKVSDEHGITMPFTFVGVGRLTNPRKKEKYNVVKNKTDVTYIFDMPMETELPDYLQYDFGLTR